MITEGRTLLVANPAAQRGGGKAAAEIAYRELVAKVGADQVDFVLTERAGHAVELVVGGEPRSDAVVAVGGDGLVHEVVNGLMRVPAGQRPAFGLVPAGSGNDFARTLGMSEKPAEAVAQLLAAERRTFDVGCCNGEHFAETLSFGLDAAIALDTVERRERTGQQGAILYLGSGIDQLLHHLDTYRFTATLDGGRELSGAALMFAVQNGPTYGGGFRICPDADPSDGLLDICYAEAPMSIPVATCKFLSAKNGRHVKMRGIRFERASRIELAFDKRPPCQVDGEPHIADSYDIWVVPRALDVLCARPGREG